ncbi:hypothetical protein Tco_0099033 [Tanacetum coccineum]
MSTLVFVDPESSTQVDGAQSSRVLVPLPEDPYEAIRQAYLDGLDTKFEPFEDIIDTETLESPLAIAPPIPLSESTPPVLFSILRGNAPIVVCVPPAMSSGLSTSMARATAMSESTLHKRFRSSYENSPFVSPPDLPSRKRYRGTSELVEDKDEGPIVEDKDPAAEDEGLTMGVEGPGMDDVGYGLDDESRGIDEEGHSVESDGLGLEEEEEAVPGTFEVGQGFGSAPESERPERVSAFRQPTLTTWTDPEDGMIYVDIPDYPPPAPPVQTPPSPEWTSGSLPIIKEEFKIYDSLI